MKGTLPQKVCQSVDGPLNAPAEPIGSAWERTLHRTSGEGTSKQTQPETNCRVGSHAAAAIGLVAISSLFLHQKSDRAMAAEPVISVEVTRIAEAGTISVPFMVAQPVGSKPGLIPEMTSVHPVYVDGLRAEIQGLWEKYYAQERSRDMPDLETPRVVPIGLSTVPEKSKQMREAHSSKTRNRHRVRDGETLGEISRQYDVSIPELMHANQLTDEDLIKVNQLLTIPFNQYIRVLLSEHQEMPQNQATPIIDRLLLEHQEMPQNQATSGDNSRDNNEALLPAEQPKQSQPAPSAGMEMTGEKTKKPEAVADQSVSPPPDTDLPEETAPFDDYVWPAEGALTSRYGWRWGRLHKGIDIAGPIGTPILSVAPGEVKLASWNRGGYGNLVEIRHSDGSLTRYAHNNRILVKKGQQVTQGQQIAEMGSTGYSTGPHLHFEFHLSGSRAVDPISYLPDRK